MHGARAFDLDLTHLVQWLTAHRDDENRDERASAVCHCIALEAPLEVQIERRLVQAGSQKRVFKARWTVADDPSDIVVKQFLNDSETLLIRERRPHPLSMTHPNIIETFTITNRASPPETFLVERWIEVLNDQSGAPGLAEAARLLVDLARALAFLADQGLVHGDVKPDNVGYRNGKYVLLDFGICRPAGQFASATQTGSLRTRAPEVLQNETSHTEASDVWALGATVFNFYLGRFPLFKDGDVVPKADKRPEQRAAFEEELRRRVAEEYDALLTKVTEVPHRNLRELLARMLARDPEARPDARQALSDALQDLPALVGRQPGPQFGAERELEAFAKHLSPDPRDLRLLPLRKRSDLSSRVDLLHRELRAQRHHERAAERVALLLERWRLDPSVNLDEDEDEAIRIYTERSRTYQLPREQRSLEVLRVVSERLELAGEIDGPPTGDDLLEALDNVLETRIAKSNEAASEIGRAATALRDLLPD